MAKQCHLGTTRIKIARAKGSKVNEGAAFSLGMSRTLFRGKF